MQVPDWWYKLSAWYLAFGIASGVLSVLLLIALLVLVLRILPLVTSLREKVDLLGTKVEILSGRATEIADRVENIAGRVEDIAAKTQHTMALVHSRTTAITGTAEEHSAEITRRLGFVSAIATSLFTVMRVVKFVKQIRS